MIDRKMEQLKINERPAQQQKYPKNDYDGSAEDDSGSEDDEAQEIHDNRRAGKVNNRKGEMFQTFGVGERPSQARPSHGRPSAQNHYKLQQQ